MPKSQTSVGKERVNQIRKIMKKNKRGIWIAQLTRELYDVKGTKAVESKRPLVYYYLRKYMFNDFVTIKQEGANKFIRLKK